MEFNEKENAVLYDFGKMHKAFAGREAWKSKMHRTGTKEKKPIKLPVKLDDEVKKLYNISKQRRL